MLLSLLLLATPDAHAIEVGICAASSHKDDVVEKVSADPRVTGVTLWDCTSVTPSLDDLRAHDVVLAFSDSRFSSPAGVGDALADYVDEGFGVVQAVFAVTDGWALEGRFATDGYGAIETGANTSPGTLNLVPVDPSHPILAGVGAFDGGTSSFHSNGVSAVGGAHLVAEWDDDGDALVAEHAPSGAGNVVTLNFYPPSSDSRDDFWTSSSDGAMLLVNALEFAADGGGAPTLTVGGSCPGPMGITATGMTPGGDVAILRGFAPGSDAVPGGPCRGAGSGLAGIGLVRLLRADGDGDVVIAPTIPDGACGRIIQLLDVSTCTFTNVAPL